MEYWINKYRTRKIEDKYFITTDSGSYAIVNEEEYRQIKENRIQENLMKKLFESEILINWDNINEELSNMRKRYNFLFSGTSLHIVVPTLRCNMKCIYCHASSKDERESSFDMTKETAEKTVDFIFQSPSKKIHLEFQGGEPLLKWDIVEYIINYSRKKAKEAGKELVISMVTNLTEMSDSKMDFLIENDVGVCTSLDGPKELHDRNRIWSKASNYDIVVSWIKRFQKRYEKDNKKDINALVTLTRESLDYPEEIVDEYARLGLTKIHLRFLNDLGNARDTWEKISYSYKEYLNFWYKAVEHIEELKKKGKKIEERIISVMTNKINNKYDPNYLDLRSPCGAAIGQLVYNYDGSIYTCDEGRMISEDLFRLGDVKNDNYASITTCDKACAVVNSSINDQYICDNCAYKPYCGICPVCNFAEQGNLIGKVSETIRCKIFMAQFDWVVRKKFINKETNKNF